MKRNYLVLILLYLFVNTNFGQQEKLVITPEITAHELLSHISFLASDELKGRMTGTDEILLAAEYIKSEFIKYGLKPVFDKSFFQEFQFIAGIELGNNNSLKFITKEEEINPALKSDFIPVSFSGETQIKGKIVFAGYGISSTKVNYDDYRDIDVTDKIVVILRNHPENNNPQSKFNEYSSLRYKASTAKEKGAAGVIFVNGYEFENDNLVQLKYDKAPIVKDFAALHIKREFIEKIFSAAGLSFKEVQKLIADSLKPASIELDVETEIETEIKEIQKVCRNVAGLLIGNDPILKDEYLVIGAHYDHLGMGEAGSLFRGEEPQVHNGADDNASGTAGVLELAQKFGSINSEFKRSIIFIAFSGEELGLLGSNYFVNHSPIPTEKMIAMFNMDMIGRLNEEKSLIVYGTGTSSIWKEELEKNNQSGFKLTFNDEGFGPSDHSSFYGKNIPVLFFFTGVHSDYHRPTDDVEFINSDGQKDVVRFIYQLAKNVATSESKPNYISVPRKEMESTRAWRVYVGTVPDFASTSDGFKISGVNDGSPAASGGMKAGDIINSFAGKAINNIYDYVYALQDCSPGDEVDVIVTRNGKKLSLKVKLGMR
ncbi:MAG TPA: M28 family peptidase [Ignavibacteriaceae bacterium]|nr:M28 family peptidase [Ignavibacteriaceae bacterium]